MKHNRTSSVTMIRVIAAAAAVAACAAFTGCNTTEGFGQDMQKLGRKIEHKADEVQR